MNENTTNLKNKNEKMHQSHIKESYLNRKNIILAVLALIVLTSWLQPELMKSFLSIIWAIIY